MNRTTVAVATAIAVGAAGAWGVGAAYAGHHDALLDPHRVTGRAADAPSPGPVRSAEAAPTEPRITLTGVAEPRKKRTPDPEPEPAPVLLEPGDRGPEVREMQARLRQIAWFTGDVTDYYGDQSRAAVAGFQAKRGLPSTGSLDTVTLERLEGMTTEPTADDLANVQPAVDDPADAAPLDPRCLTGRVLCVDKTSSSLRWVVDGEVRLTVDARFGGNGYTTREGEFTVDRMSRDHVSSLYDTSMPFAMFFSGGQAVHYSPDFAATGYAGSSHGCVNVRDYEGIAWLYDQVRIGDKVVVSWT